MPADPSEWATPLPPTTGDRWRAIVPALLLGVVALVGVRNHLDHDQSSWEGASFGMFSTYDNDSSRLVVVTVEGPDGSYRARLPEDLRDDGRRLRVAPSQAAIDRLAENVADEAKATGATSVTVELWQVGLDDDPLRLRYERTLTADGDAVIRRANAALRAMDPLVLLLRSSLLALLVNSNDDPVVLVGVGIVCLVALPRPAVLRSPWLWAGLFVAIGLRQLSTWHLVDDHIIVTTYWCAALALGLTAREPRRTLAASARLLVGVLFVFAAAWKLGSGEFADGTFFRYSLLFDDRFATVARLIGGTTHAMSRANAQGLQALGQDPATGALVLQEGPRNQALAYLFTGWGILIESAVAIAFLVPLKRRWEALRPAALIAFAATTYLIVPVGGFGTLLLVLGSAQTSSDRLRVAYLWGAAALLVWAAVWPILFL